LSISVKYLSSAITFKTNSPALPGILKTKKITMKKTAMVLAAAVTICLCSCGGDAGLKKDVESTAKLECEKQALRDQMDKGDTTVTAKYEQVKKELDELEEKLMVKYKDKMDDKAFGEKAKKYEDEAKAKKN